MRPRFGPFAGLSSMVGGRRLCQMLCFTMGYMLICVVRVSAVVRKSRFFPSPPLSRSHVLRREFEVIRTRGERSRSWASGAMTEAPAGKTTPTPAVRPGAKAALAKRGEV